MKKRIAKILLVLASIALLASCGAKKKTSKCSGDGLTCPLGYGLKVDTNPIDINR